MRFAYFWSKAGASRQPCHTCHMEKRADHLTATYVDMAVNVAAVFGIEVGLRVLRQTTPLHVVQRVLSDDGPRRRGAVRDTPRQIVSAQRYLAQNYRMDYLTEYTAHVTGERLLNLCKAFESLIPASIFAGDPTKQDVRIRSFLEIWKVHENYIDVLISLRKLRSSLDIAHTRRSPISTEGHQAIESFIPLAEACVRSLINLALEKFNLDPATYPEEKNEIEDISALKYLLRYADTPAPTGDIRIRPPSPD